MAVESVDMNFVVVTGDKNAQDSILNALNAGKAFAEVVNGATVQGQENAKQTLIGIAEDVKAKILGAGANYFVVSSSDQAATIAKVIKKEEPKQFYNVAVITHKVYPSKETVNGLRDNLQAFINENATLAALDSNAVKNGYQPMPVVVYSNTPQVNGINGTRDAVKWMFAANEGSVSPIFDVDSKNKMMVVAVEKVFDGEYLPMNERQINDMITYQVRNEKKGAALAEKYNGKASDIAGYAQVMNADVDTAQVTFGQQFIPGLGMGENAFVASVATAEEGKLSEVVKGNNAVYVYQVIKHNRSERTPGAEVARQFATTRGSSAVMQNVEGILRGATKVENNMIRFF
jgi:peptidyl-prolyl cis-trans isomerase D